MIILSILLALANFIIGFVVGMFALYIMLDKKGLLKDSDKE